MLKRTVLSCCLMLLLTAFCNNAFAGILPYASILAYNEDVDNMGPNGGPNINTLQTLNIINMTPWDISIGSKPGSNIPMLVGMTRNSISPFWMSGINGSTWTPGKPVATQGTNMGFAFHSIQIPVNNTNNPWVMDHTLPGPGKASYWTSIPITFNSQNGAQGSNTASLNFMAASSGGLSANNGYNPLTMLMYGDGQTINYAYSSYATSYVGYQSNVTDLLTIQAVYPQGAPTGVGKWYPAANLVPTTSPQGYTFPQYVTAAGLVLPNFSQISGIPKGQSYDLVVLLQSGNYADMSLIFLAVPSDRNTFYSNGPAQATAPHR